MMKKAFTLVEILIVVAIIGLLSAIAVPSFLKYRSAADDQMKDVNIETINAAKDQWAILNNQTPGTSVTWSNIQDYVGSGVNDLSEFDMGGEEISINDVGEPAEYVSKGD